jgi:hypothetical protein
VDGSKTVFSAGGSAAGVTCAILPRLDADMASVDSKRMVLLDPKNSNGSYYVQLSKRDSGTDMEKCLLRRSKCFRG